MKLISDIPESFFAERLTTTPNDSGGFTAMDGLTRAVGYGSTEDEAIADYYSILSDMIPWLTDVTFTDSDILAWKQALYDAFGWED